MFVIVGNKTVNVETGSVLPQDSWILFAGRAKPNQFHGFTWSGVALSGKSLLPRQFWFQVALEFRAPLALERYCPAPSALVLLEDAVSCGSVRNSSGLRVSCFETGAKSPRRILNHKRSVCQYSSRSTKVNETNRRRERPWSILCRSSTQDQKTGTTFNKQRGVEVKDL